MKKRKKKPAQAVKKSNKRHRSFGWPSRFKQVGIVLVVLCVLFLSWSQIHDPTVLPIKVITIDGEHPHVDQKTLQSAISPYRQNNFFTLNLSDLKERLLQISWVESVFIAKEWPNRLHIQIKEKQAIALWNEDALLNDKLQPFLASRTQLPRTLPQLSGPPGEQIKVWEAYQKYNQLLARLHLQITKLELSQQQTWTLQLNNGLRLVLGEQNNEERLERFIKAYPTLAQNSATIEYIDLRYHHGLAVRYQDNLA